jgi:hypothetical protein
MSDDAAKHFASETKDKPAGRSYTLTITLQPTGELELSGPLQNKVLALGLLAAATAQLTQAYTMNEVNTRVEKAAASRGVNGLLKRINGG